MAKPSTPFLEERAADARYERKEFKSELAYLRHFHANAPDAVWSMVEATMCIAVALKVIDGVRDKTTLSDNDTSALHGVEVMLRGNIETLNKGYERIIDHDLLYGFPPGKKSKKKAAA